MKKKFNQTFKPGQKIMYRDNLSDDWRQYILECEAYMSYGKLYCRFVGVERQIELSKNLIQWPDRKIKPSKIVIGIKNECLIYK
jgi:hypothetical protein